MRYLLSSSLYCKRCLRPFLNRAASTQSKRLEVEFSDEESRNILDKVNTLSVSELHHKYKVPENRANNLVEFRQQNGTFTDISDLLKVKGFGSKAFESVCARILRADSWTSNDSKYRYVIDKTKINPRFTSRERPESVLACNVQLDTVSWLLMTEDLAVYEWQQLPLFDRPRLKYNHAYYQPKIWEVVQNLPMADLYLMEDFPIIVPNMIAAPSALNRARLDATITTLLNHRTPQDASLEHRVFKIKPSVIGEYFNLLIGGERTSSRQVVRAIFRETCEEARGVYISPNLTQQFYSLFNKDREKMAACLLQAVTFYKLLEDSKD